jgi:hypothetical protein
MKKTRSTKSRYIKKRGRNTRRNTTRKTGGNGKHPKLSPPRSPPRIKGHFNQYLTQPQYETPMVARPTVHHRDTPQQHYFNKPTPKNSHVDDESQKRIDWMLGKR